MAEGEKLKEKWEIGEKEERGISKLMIVIPVVVIVAIVGVSAFLLLQGKEEEAPPGPGPTAFVVFNDEGIPSGSGVYTWDSYREWSVGTGEATFDSEYTEIVGIPEGSKCFLTISDNSNTYAGWGVFLLAELSDLSNYSQLKFWIKTSTNLKVGAQQTDANGTKKELYVNSYGWDGTDTWQEITIPKSAFSPVDFTQIYCPFLITVESTGKTFYVDQIRWVL